MLVKLVHFYIIEPQRPIGGLIRGGWRVKHDNEHCHFVSYLFDQTCNLTLAKNT